MTHFLSFRYWPVGGAVRSEPVAWESDAQCALKSVAVPKLAGLAAGRDLVFLVHGYNNSQRDAVCALSRLDTLLAMDPGPMVLGIRGPGDSLFGGVSYPVEKPTAAAVGRYLAGFCNMRLKDAGSISFASHSLGGRVVLETIRRLDRPARTACLMAAAIERTCLHKEYADAFANVDRISVLASQKDSVLRLAFPIGNMVAHWLNPTANPLSDALGYAGPPGPIGNTLRPWQIADSDAYNHGNYMPPSAAAAAFPDPAGKFNRTAQFLRRSFDGHPQTWPV